MPAVDPKDQLIEAWGMVRELSNENARLRAVLREIERIARGIDPSLTKEPT